MQNPNNQVPDNTPSNIQPQPVDATQKLNATSDPVAAEPTAKISIGQRRTELDQMWLWLHELETLEVRIFETGIRAFIRSGGPSPSIFTTHLGVSKDTHRMIDDWMAAPIIEADGKLRVGARQWMLLVDQSRNIREAVLLLLESISSHAFVNPQQQLPTSYSRLQRDVEWFALAIQAVNAVCGLLSDAQLSADEEAANEVAQIQPLISQCALQVGQTARFFKQYSQQYPEAVLGEKELLLLRAYQQQYVTQSKGIPPEGLTRQKIALLIVRSDDTVRRVCQRLEQRGLLAPLDKHERRSYNSTEVDLIVRAYLKTRHRWQDK